MAGIIARAQDFTHSHGDMYIAEPESFVSDRLNGSPLPATHTEPRALLDHIMHAIDSQSEVASASCQSLFNEEVRSVQPAWHESTRGCLQCHIQMRSPQRTVARKTFTKARAIA